MNREDRARYRDWLKKGILVECGLVALLAALVAGKPGGETEASFSTNTLSVESDYIKWVDFTVSYDALCNAYEWDVETHGTEYEIDWIDLLAYTAARTGGTFDKSALKTMERGAQAISTGEETLESLTKDLKYFSYYKEAYSAALGGLVGEYRQECTDETGNVTYEDKYGLKGYFPLAKGFEYSHYDDFGVGRSYGYKRRHLGHDMMGQTGTPIISVESGVVEALGWNQYGGWRIGIRSFDGKRYYYYAHLRQNYPFAEGLEVGSVVTAGDVIGYMGHTGYSTKENVNNIEVTHLHWGLELIFDESQKESDNEIWIDLYALTRFLAKHTQAAEKVGDTREWVRSSRIIDPAVEEYKSNTVSDSDSLTGLNRDPAEEAEPDSPDENEGSSPAAP